MLKVGSTFDYPPLTYIQNGKYVGDDIRIIEDFAKTNKLKINFTKTYWKSLSKDLNNGMFDVAVGGITDNPERKNLFLISLPISQFSKSALVICEDKTKYSSLKQINVKKVRVVENIGGTNLYLIRYILMFVDNPPFVKQFF